MTIVIGLMGPAGAGKSTAAAYLVEKYGAKRYSFADPLKQFAMSALEFTHEQCYGTQAEKEAPDPRYGGKSARWFLQRLGTEGGRKTFGESFWTEQALSKILADKPSIAVIEDARFVSEANAIRVHIMEGSAYTFRGFVWKLHSPGRETVADASHASESEWLDAPCDYIVSPAERGLEHLYRCLDDAARHTHLRSKP